MRLKIILCSAAAPLSTQLEMLRLGLDSGGGWHDWYLENVGKCAREDALKDLSLKSYGKLGLNCSWVIVSSKAKYKKTRIGNHWTDVQGDGSSYSTNRGLSRASICQEQIAAFQLALGQGERLVDFPRSFPIPLSFEFVWLASSSKPKS